MFVNQTFYFATVRKITAGFGSLFTNIHVNRSDGKVFRVPFSHGPRDSYIAQREERRREETKVRISVPRMSFEMTNLTYDPSRKLQTVNRNLNINTDDPDYFLSQLTPVPYDIGYDVNIIVKYYDDALQIIEQILPYFSPSYNLTIEDIPEMGLIRDVPVVYNSSSFSDSYEGDPNDARIINWTLSFTAKGYMYPNIHNAAVIKKVIANMHDGTVEKNQDLERITVQVDPIDASETDDWEAKTIIEQAPYED